MRFLTTLLLATLTAGGAGYWYWRNHNPSAASGQTSASVEELQKITTNSLVRIEIGDAVLQRDGSVWNLDGGWPTRAADVQNYVELLSGLHSRFAPVGMDGPDRFGLDASQQPVVVTAVLKLPSGADKTCTLTFGKPKANGGNPFTRPTYLRIDDKPEVLRMAPTVYDEIRKSRADFLRRQIFPDVVRAKVGEGVRSPMGGEAELPPAAVPLLEANVLTVSSPDGAWTLKRTAATPLKSVDGKPVTTSAEALAGRWELSAPVVDRVDPDRLRTILNAVPDLWAEDIKPKKDGDKAATTKLDLPTAGLDNPERTVTVKNGDRELKLLIGKVSRVEEKKAPPPPPANPFSPPPPAPPPQREEYRYAKLPNHPQIFEVRTDRFAELFVKPSDLRDARLARFKPADVKKLELVGKDRKLVFVKEKDAATNDERWKITDPVTAFAEGPKIIELIEKLDQLQAREADVIDATDLKLFGLSDADPTTTLTLSITEEEPGPTPDAPKTSTSRTVAYRFGKQETGKPKLYVQVAGVARINAVADDLLKLLERPALAYRSRRVIDIPDKKLARITVERPNDGFALAQTNDKWSLADPVQAAADAAKAATLVNDLARLDVVEFVNFTPTPDDLKKYGLDTSTLKVVLAPNDSSVAGKTLVIGAVREGKPEVYARLADAPEVFAIRQTVKDAVEQPSLALRPLQLWQTAGNLVDAIEVEHAGNKYKLSRDGAFWKISGPFAATAWLPAVQPFVEAASAPKADRLEAHANTDPAKYGLDKPEAALRVTLKAERPEDPAGTKEILLGKKVAEGLPARYASCPDQPGVFVVSGAMADALAKPALDLLDRKLLSLDTRQITKIEGVGPAGPWSAKKDGDRWQIDSLSPPAAGDRAVIDGLVAVFTDVRAQKFAAYGAQDLAKYGLDKPEATVTVSFTAGDKPIHHTIAMGKPSEDGSQARFARVDNGEAIAVLPVLVSMELSRSALELVDRGMLKFDPFELNAIKRTGDGVELVLEKKDSVWQVVKPASVPGDNAKMVELAERLGNLRAVKVAALAAKDLKPFGLDPPAATLTLTIKNATGSPRELTLKLGGPAQPEGRYAQAGSDAVFVIPDGVGDPLAARLLAPPIKFRDPSLGHFTDADRVTITRGDRSVTFAKVDGRWKMTAPIAAEAEAFELDDLVLAASKLRAEELAADQPGDLKPFGLDKPAADVKFYLGDKEVYHLLVGAKEADGHVFVKPASGDLVGKLDAAVAGRVTAEFRKRSPWTNLDAAQVDNVIINAGAGGRPFMLTKGEGGAWQVADQPQQPVKAELVSEVLAALAALKIERYVADHKADLKLYGLDPAERVLVVKGRTGQPTTLHLGRYEGDSKRVYATLPGADWVAVLSEADTAKLMKATTDFMGK